MCAGVVTECFCTMYRTGYHGGENNPAYAFYVGPSHSIVGLNLNPECMLWCGKKSTPMWRVLAAHPFSKPRVARQLICCDLGPA